MHRAGNIADKYLTYLAKHGERGPNMSMLAATSLLMAAKMEEPFSPCFEKMIEKLPEPQCNKITRQDLIDLEK